MNIQTENEFNMASFYELSEQFLSLERRRRF